MVLHSETCAMLRAHRFARQQEPGVMAAAAAAEAAGEDALQAKLDKAEESAGLCFKLQEHIEAFLARHTALVV